jgi:uncharacterized protein
MVSLIPSRPLALVTGASSGIGKVYADRLAARGYDLILVARNLSRLDEIAANLAQTYGTSVTPMPADLGDADDVARVMERLEGGPNISLLVNNAGLGPEGPVSTSSPVVLEAMLRLNVIALNTLSVAAAKTFAARGDGAIINIASVTALMPEKFNAAYSATKAFVLALTQGLNAEFSDKGVRFQAVLPGLTRTEIFERAGVDINRLNPDMIMEVGDMVDAALAGFDQGELITIPSLDEPAMWQVFEAARRALWPHTSNTKPAVRYTTTQPA